MAAIKQMTPEDAKKQATLESNLTVELMAAQRAGVSNESIMSALGNLLAFGLVQTMGPERAIQHMREAMPLHVKHAVEQVAIVEKLQRGGRLDG